MARHLWLRINEKEEPFTVESEEGESVTHYPTTFLECPFCQCGIELSYWHEDTMYRKDLEEAGISEDCDEESGKKAAVLVFSV